MLCMMTVGIRGSKASDTTAEQQSEKMRTPGTAPPQLSPEQASPSTPHAPYPTPHPPFLRHLGCPGEDFAKGFHDPHSGSGSSSKTLSSNGVTAGLPVLAKAAGDPVTPVAKERRPLMKKSLDAASWKLYQQKLAVREPRKPLQFQYPAGMIHS